MVDFRAHFGMLAQELLCVFTPLPDTGFLIGIPCAALVYDIHICRQIQNIPLLGDALAVDNIKLGCSEGRCYLVFRNLYLCAVADNFRPLLQHIRLSDFHTDRGIEFQCAAARCGFGIAEGYADFLTQLVDENNRTIRFIGNTCQLSQCLAHQSCLQAHVGITHFALDFRTGHQCRYRVHNHNINRTAAYHGFGDFQRLFAVIRLRNIEVININPQRLCISGVHRMLRIHIPCNAAALLHLCHHVQGNRCLTGGFRAINLNDSALRQTANPQRQIQAQRAGRHNLNRHFCIIIPQLHYRTLAKLLLNLA